jgi:SSS family solute:Na+ symporter/sodium/pantothenate symporter
MMGIASTFRPYFLLGIDPIVWGLVASCLCGIGTSLLTAPPPEKLVSRMFDATTPAPRAG